MSPTPANYNFDPMEELINNLNSYLAGNSLLAFPAAFVAGLLISFTPCVYPVIPIQLGFIGARTAAAEMSGEKVGGRINFTGLKLSVMFVIGMSIVYAALVLLQA